jgi:2-polyprenyl-6-methoxyphenol hydroxylase-like FAD-dependent oxidoreductase
VRPIAGDNALKAVIVVGEYSCSWIVIVASPEKHPFQSFQWFQPFHRFALFKGGALFKVQGSMVQCLTAVQGSIVQKFNER